MSAAGRGIDRSPARVSAAAAAVAALVAVGVSTTSSLAAAAGIAGFFPFLAGLVRGYTPAVSLGTVGLLAGVLVAGTRGAPPPVVLVGAAATVLAWDAAGTALVLGRQLGRAADTARAEAVHLAASAAVALLVVGAGYGLFLASADGLSVAALLCFLLAAVLLASALG